MNRVASPIPDSGLTASAAGLRRAALILAIALQGLCGCTREPTFPRFVDLSAALTSSRGPAEYGPLWADLDGDGYLDLVFFNHAPPSFYFNRPGAGFLDRLPESGIRLGGWEYSQQGDRHGGACADFDNDGDVDLYIAHGAKRGETLGVKYDELLVNRGDGTFEDVSLEAGATNRAGRARTGRFFDYDGDGWLDLALGNFESPNVLYRNRGDGTFEDVTAREGLSGWTGPRTLVGDLDGDGVPELLAGWPLRLYRRGPGGGFVDATATAGLEGAMFPYSMALGDADGDGDPDLFLGSSEAAGILYLNQAGVFTPGPSLALEAGERGGGSAWGDLDNDGDPDLVRMGTRGIRLFLNQGRLRFVSRDLWRAGQPLEQGGGLALGDYDRDGRLDIAFDSGEGQGLLRNRGGQEAWIQLRLSGTRSNRSAFGAAVRIRWRSGWGAGRSLSRQYWGEDWAFRSSGCGPLHAGLGEAGTVDVSIRWPSGRETILRQAAVNRVLEVEEPAGER